MTPMTSTPVFALVDLARACDDAREVAVLTRAVIDTGNGRAALAFARDVPEADIEHLQEFITDHGDLDIMLCFARDVPGADIDHLQDKIIDSRDIHAMIAFARIIPGANIESLRAAAYALGVGARTEFDRQVPSARKTR